MDRLYLMIQLKYLFLLLILICVGLMIYFIIENKQEHLTLVTNCKLREESCLIACIKSNGKLDELCFKTCKEISPYC